MPLPSLWSFLKHLLFQFLKANEFSPHVNFLMLPNRSVETGMFIYLSGHVSTCFNRKKKKKDTSAAQEQRQPHTLLPIHYALESMCETVFMMLAAPWRQDVELGIAFISGLHHIWEQHLSSEQWGSSGHIMDHDQGSKDHTPFCP